MVDWKLIVYHQLIVSATETFYKMASMICQKWFKKPRYLSKSSNFVHFGLYDLVQISPAFSPNTKRKIFCKKWFSDRVFRLPLLTLTLEVSSLSIHYSISIWTTCWWNLNKIAWYEVYKILTFLAKKVNHFFKTCVDAIFEEVPLT